MVTIDGPYGAASLSLLNSLGWFFMDMVWVLCGRSLVLYLRCLKIFCVWTLYVYPSGSIPRSRWSLNLVIPSYPRSYTRGRVIGGDFSYSLHIMMISFIKDSSGSFFLTMSLKFFGPITPASGVSILIILTPAPLVLGRINVSFFYLSDFI